MNLMTSKVKLSLQNKTPLTRVTDKKCAGRRYFSKLGQRIKIRTSQELSQISKEKKKQQKNWQKYEKEFTEECRMADKSEETLKLTTNQRSAGYIKDEMLHGGFSKSLR